MGDVIPYYRVKAVAGNWLEQFEWCCETFGSPSTIAENPRWFQRQCQWVSVGDYFIFREEANISLYLLRWSKADV